MISTRETDKWTAMSWFLKIDKIVFFLLTLRRFQPSKQIDLSVCVTLKLLMEMDGHTGVRWDMTHYIHFQKWRLEYIFPSRSPRLILKAKACHCLLPCVIVWVWSGPLKNHVFKQLLHVSTHLPAKLLQKPSAECIIWIWILIPIGWEG